MRQRLDFIRSQGQVVDSDIIDQAGEESSGFEIITGTDVQSAIGGFKRILSGYIFCDFCAVHIKDPVRAVPCKADMMPLAVRNNRFRDERLRDKASRRKEGPGRS